MSAPKDPLFVERRTYRRRRMADAVRLLPFLGAGLLLFPILWIGAPAGKGIGTATAMLYVFGVWIGLAGLALACSLLLRPEPPAADPDDPGDPDDPDDPVTAPAPAPARTRAS